MPTKTTKTTTKTKTKGKGLSKKIGPFPLWSLIVIAVVLIGFIILRKRSSGSTNATTDNASGFLSPNVQPIDNAQAGQPSMNSAPASGLDQSTLDALTSAIGASQPTDYVTKTDLSGQLNDLQDSLSADIASATFPGAGSSPLKTTTTAAKPQASKPTATPTKKTTASAPKPAVKYYTYKKDVPLKKGQTLHFTTGKGYYAA